MLGCARLGRVPVIDAGRSYLKGVCAMAPSPRKLRVDPSTICGIRWIHVFEQDTGVGAVYRPETDRIPLARRPREQLELQAGGAAQVFVGGADDRPVPRAGRWRATSEGIMIELPAAGREQAMTWRIVEATPTRVVVSIVPP